MKVEEIIERIKALPQSDKVAVMEFVRNLKTPPSQSGLEMKDAPAPSSVNYMDRETFTAAKKRVFQRHAELLDKLSK